VIISLITEIKEVITTETSRMITQETKRDRREREVVEEEGEGEVDKMENRGNTIMRTDHKRITTKSTKKNSQPDRCLMIQTTKRRSMKREKKVKKIFIKGKEEDSNK
jgi:hypothetical protein